MDTRSLLAAVLLVAVPVGCDSAPESSTSSSEKRKEANSESAGEESDDETDENSGLGKPIPGGESPRRITLNYEMTLQPGDRDGPVDIFIPLAVDTAHQEILERNVEAPVEGEIRTEETYDNQFWYGSLSELPDDPLTIRLTYQVRRKVFQRADLAQKSGESFEEGYRDEYDLYLQSNERVPTDGELIDETATKAGLEETKKPHEAARNIYDYVVDTMEYKKVGSGWGNGDTYWACNEEYGNCTDFHALFTSLARHEGIPARFEIGLPVPTDRKSGKIGGYHCWIQFYLPEVGWTPLDASAAKKNPELREMYFGTHPANRVRFTVGRDLQLGEDHDTGALNYFIYPMVEVGDERYDGVETSFSFETQDS